MPRIIVSGGPEHHGSLSAIYGQVTDASTPNLGSKTASISEHDKLVKAFNQRRPLLKGYESRVSSWSDPVSARGILEDEDQMKEKRPRSQLKRSNADFVETSTDEQWRKTRLLDEGLRR
jgi:hypothetical protein